MDLLHVVFIIVIVLIVTSIYFYLTKNYNHWKLQNVPCAPNAIPGFGHILSLFTLQDNLGTLVHKLYQSMSKKSMYGCYVLRTPAILLRDPNLIENVLQRNFSSFRNNFLSVHEHLDPILSKNPFFAKDDLWSETRAVLAENFSGRKMKCMLVITLSVCDKLMKCIDNNDKDFSFELKDLFSRTSAEIVANSSFGMDGNSFENISGNHIIVNLAKNVFDLTTIRYVQQLILYFLPRLANIMKIGIVPKKTNSIVKNHFKNFAQVKLKNNEINSDFLQFSKADLNGLDENMILAKSTSILFDGYETTSSVLAFMIYRLSENSHVQDKARKEVTSVLKKFDNKLSYEAVNNLNYLEQVMLETLRLNPTFGDVTKICNKKTTLQGHDELYCHLKPNDIVLISIMGIHMDEEFWPNPSKFDPDRFNPHEMSARHKFTYLGFGGGPRVCPGKRMGTLIVKTIVAVLLKNYVLEKSSKMKGPLKLSTSTFATIVDDGLWVNFRPIKKN